jgi:hypothetical protein
MDSTRFDALTRSLATATNRRALVRSALAAVAAGVGGAMGRGSVLADGCKEDGKLCKKHEQCCSGLCRPSPGASSTSASDSVCCTPDSNESTCSGLCGLQTNNCGQSVDCGACCSPDPHEVTCAGVYGPQENNCKQIIDCDLGTGEPCAGDEQCASDHCCETCVDCSTVSETATSCGACGNCCECFQNNAPGGGNALYCCPSNREICGTYPDDECCLPQDTCVDGRCVPIPLACPPEANAGGPNQDCPSGCCGGDGTVTNPGICCPTARPDCVQGACVAVTSISCADQSVCPNGTICTAYDGNDGECCPSNRYYEIKTGDPDMPLAKACCSNGSEARGCELYCTPVSYLGCSATFRGSQPRIG